MPLSYPPVLVFGDIVADLAVLFRQHPLLAGVNVVSDQKRFDRDESSLYLYRSGGRRLRFFDIAYVMFEARAPHLDIAYDISQAARGIGWSVPGRIDDVVAVEDGSGPLLLTDAVNGDSYYVSSTNFRTRGHEPQP